ncbi:hypothetical protein QQF64_001806 [Cirrhinus molitorella]|uniref:Uncharacterized protein n=1 Tax=Cirrhinus molitorella TaxID=172907 RepID=A0ABR3MNB7_9TELE
MKGLSKLTNPSWKVIRAGSHSSLFLQRCRARTDYSTLPLSRRARVAGRRRRERERVRELLGAARMPRLRTDAGRTADDVGRERLGLLRSKSRRRDPEAAEASASTFTSAFLIPPFTQAFIRRCFSTC